jgi:hypothetical protein
MPAPAMPIAETPPHFKKLRLLIGFSCICPPPEKISYPVI